MSRTAALSVDPKLRAAYYNEAFPKRPPLSGTEEWVTGTWAVGSCYKNPNPLYGAYPRSYLERVHAMFPDRCEILHAFSGGLTAVAAVAILRTGLTTRRINLELVDSAGPEQGRSPTWQGRLEDMPAVWNGRFDLILADPPYSPQDAEKYGTPMPNRAKIMQVLRRVAQPGCVLVWLDQVWPMHRKDQWKCFGQIGLVRSTNHRVRLVSMFEAV